MSDEGRSASKQLAIPFPRNRAAKANALAAGRARPFLKWAGGKRQLLPELLGRVPQRLGTYFEPFVGGGALFFATLPDRAVLADQNRRLIRAYRGVQGGVERVIGLLRTYPHERGFFEEMRKHDVDAEADDAAVAAWLVYLNKTAFNGLYRVNSKDVFNVPFGRYANPNLCDEDNLRACSVALAGARLEHVDFEGAVDGAEKGDFVYFDPPYVPLSATASFTSYTVDGFAADDQLRLRDVARRLKRKGVKVLLSNSSAPFVREAYGKGFRLDEVAAVRSVNSKGDRRGAVTELLIS